MIRSMTGFGSATEAASGATVRVELRSVNHRHLQTKLRVPADLLSLEPDFEARLRKSLSRGAVSVHVHVSKQGRAMQGTIDQGTARSYLKELKGLARELKLKGDVELPDLLGLPGVITTGEKEGVGPNLERLGRRAFSAALKDLLEMREQEGASMARDLELNASQVERILRRIEKRMPTVIKQHQAGLRKRVAELMGVDRTSLAPSDLARELALIAERLDVSEETVRLNSHLGQLRRLLEKGGLLGRKLDFLVQEFFREANTVGSKCNDAKLAMEVVDLKTHIERLREQVQNIE